MNSKAARQLQDDGEAGHLVSPLYLPDVRRCQPGSVGEVFLRPASLRPQLAKRGAKQFTLSSIRHTCQVTIVTLSCPVTVVTVSRRFRTATESPTVVAGAFSRDLRSRRVMRIELPDFLIFALEARVAEANIAAQADDRCTLNDYIETELVNVITLRDVAELDLQMPGFAEAVHEWVVEMRE